MDNSKPVISSPKTIIYKTRKDFTQNVPVILSEDKKNIVSFPDIKDVVINGHFAYPTPLVKGFLLDNKGINENVAFISLTYEAYSHLKNTPNAEELMKMVIDNDPITEMYSCGPKSKTNAEELNKVIDSGDFSSFKKIK